MLSQRKDLLNRTQDSERRILGTRSLSSSKNWTSGRLCSRVGAVLTVCLIPEPLLVTSPFPPPSPVLKDCCRKPSLSHLDSHPNPFSRPSLIGVASGHWPHLMSHSLTPGSLDIKFSNTCQFRWFLNWGRLHLEGLLLWACKKAEAGMI